MTFKVIVRTAITSRVILFIIQYLSNIIIPDHDAGVFTYPKLSPVFVADKIVDHFLGGFIRWDAQYFVHIAKFGYTYENTLAFFPLYPLLGRVSTDLLSWIEFLSYDRLLLVVLLSINFVLFILTAISLYNLSSIILNEQFAYNATVLFCFNPASVFFSAPYTECLFCYLTFKSMLNCIRLFKLCSGNHLQVKNLLLVIPISLTAFTRSNGILNIGFLVYSLMCAFLVGFKTRNLLHIVKFTVITVFALFISILPFISFQYYSYKQFCTDFLNHLSPNIVNYAESNSFILPGQFSKYHQQWCFKFIPFAYSYVQDHYWNVGFLRYYKIKQIPNFLLALPIVHIIVLNSFHFFRQFPKTFSNIFCFHLLFNRKDTNSKFQTVMFVFVVHALILTVFCVLCIHVQVTTRMLCSCSPIPYWFGAFYFRRPLNCNLFKDFVSDRNDFAGKLILGYFLGYFVVGTIMFCNFLPFT